MKSIYLKEFHEKNKLWDYVITKFYKNKKNYL